MLFPGQRHNVSNNKKKDICIINTKFNLNLYRISISILNFKLFNIKKISSIEFYK